MSAVQSPKQTVLISAITAGASNSIMLDSGATQTCSSGKFYDQYRQVLISFHLCTTPEGSNNCESTSQGITDPLETELKGKAMSTWYLVLEGMKMECLPGTDVVLNMKWEN